jgi:hypothetical protein
MIWMPMLIIVLFKSKTTPFLIDPPTEKVKAPASHEFNTVDGSYVQIQSP